MEAANGVFYNEIDAYAAQWLRNLAAAGHLPGGFVDERSILDLDPDDLRPFRQCHFFAGIGGWPYALELAGWPDDREVWTGSCPCQPLSSAGQRKGHADERHLWPAFYDLIAECRPATVFGEQVASKDGREWLSGVRADLEHLGYAVGAADLSAAGVGAPHIRQRLFWVAHAGRQRDEPRGHGVDGAPRAAEGKAYQRQRVWSDNSDGGATGGVAYHAEPGRDAEGRASKALPQPGAVERPNGCGDAGGLADAERNRHGSRDELMEGTGPQDCANGQAIGCGPGHGGLADASDAQWGPLGQHRDDGRDGAVGGLGDAASGRREEPPQRDQRAQQSERSASFGTDAFRSNPWSSAVWLPCLDGKARRVEPDIFPVADGVPARVGRLRAYGNAIVPQAAAAFVRTCIGASP